MQSRGSFASPASRVVGEILSECEALRCGKAPGVLQYDTEVRKHRGMNWKALREAERLHAPQMSSAGLFWSVPLSLFFWACVVVAFRMAP